MTEHLRGTVSAYLAGDAYNFALHGRELRDSLRSLNPALYPSDSALGLEYTYNHLGAFPRAASLYLIGLIALAVAGGRKASWATPVRWLGLLASAGGLVFHTTGLVMRCIVAGRPPVTNMYESMIWVSFVVTVLGFIFYARYRGLTYLLAALPVSAFTLFLTQQVPAALPENIDPLVPVLRDNFWLSTHVLTITASYGAFALGMGFAHIVLFRYLMNPVEARADQVLHFWLYRVLQLGVLMIAIGTILGGVWANYSWGRFWGWDPKETWAFITLLCYIVALHGRIAGWWGQFGLAVAGVLCFAAVVMAWYGVNFVLGKGLHSYGKGIGGEGYVAAILVADMIFLAAACWRQLSTPTLRGGVAGGCPAKARGLSACGGLALGVPACGLFTAGGRRRATSGNAMPAPIRGMTISTHTWGAEWDTPAMEQTLDELQSLGVNSVAIHPYARVHEDGHIVFRNMAPILLSREASGGARARDGGHADPPHRLLGDEIHLARRDRLPDPRRVGPVLRGLRNVDRRHGPRRRGAQGRIVLRRPGIHPRAEVRGALAADHRGGARRLPRQADLRRQLGQLPGREILRRAGLRRRARLFPAHAQP